MTTIDEKMLPLATKVLEESNSKAKEDSHQIDPMTILTIISLLIKLATFLWEWYRRDKDKFVKSNQLNFIMRWVVWRHVKKDVVNRKDAKYIYEGICGMVYKFTDDDRKTLIEVITEKGK